MFDVKLVKAIFHRYKIYLPSSKKVVKRLTKRPVFCMCLNSVLILNESLCTKFSQNLYLNRSFQILKLIPVGTHACYMPYPIPLHVFILTDPMS